MMPSTGTLRHPIVIMDTMNPAADEHLTSEQLSLLPSATTPARFRLSKDTRERGLRHVAEIRRMLAERAEAQHGRAA
jgi:hypothetical protein